LIRTPAPGPADIAEAAAAVPPPQMAAAIKAAMTMAAMIPPARPAARAMLSGAAGAKQLIPPVPSTQIQMEDWLLPRTSLRVLLSQ